MTRSLLRGLRAYQGLTQHDLAGAIGRSQTYICSIEQGRKPTAVEARRLAGLLDVRVEVLWPDRTDHPGGVLQRAFRRLDVTDK